MSFSSFKEMLTENTEGNDLIDPFYPLIKGSQ